MDEKALRRSCSTCERLNECPLWEFIERVWSKWSTTVTPVDAKVERCDGKVARASLWERGVGPETRYVVFEFCLVCGGVKRVIISNVSDVIFSYTPCSC